MAYIRLNITVTCPPRATYGPRFHLKETTDVSNGWLADQLDMGGPIYVSKYVGQLRREPHGEAHTWLKEVRKNRGKA